MAATKKRNANIELLRMISMFMVVLLHALGKGNLLVNLSDNHGVNAVIAWGIESLSLSAVNIFILISGYFLINSTFKIGRVIELVCETIFYSLGAFLICLLFGIETGEKINTYFLLHTVFPVHMDLFWFLTAYIVIYILQPVISAGAKNITEKQFKTTLIVLVIFECLFKSFLPFRFEEDQFGYNVLWFLIMFLIGAYFRLYGFKYLNSAKKGFCLYALASLLIFAENAAIDFVINKTGHLTEIEGVSTEYNHIFVLLAAIGIFAAFVNMKEREGAFARIVCFLSPMSLGVYLLHENLSLRYNWQKWLGIYDSLGMPVYMFLPRLFLAALIIYIAGTVVDFVRIKLFEVFGRIVTREK